MVNDFLINVFGLEFIFLVRNYISNFGVILIPHIYIAYKLIDLFVRMRESERESESGRVWRLCRNKSMAWRRNFLPRWRDLIKQHLMIKHDLKYERWSILKMKKILRHATI